MCENHKFVQVHCHTSASLLDGVNTPEKLAKKAKEFGHPALAITDHGMANNLFTFAQECKKEGIKPILGLEFYICNDLTSRIPNRQRELEEKDYHQSTYIKNKEGYKNFCELTYRSFTDGYYYKPRIDFDSLIEKKNGLMITSSCMASKTSQYILNDEHKKAEELFRKLCLEFGEDFYGEIQFNEVEGQKQINDFIIHLCNKYDVPILIGGDVHYLNPEDNELQDAVIRSKRSSSSKSDDESDWVISARHLYFHDTKDYYEFNKKFGFNYDTKLLEEAFENSIKFSEKPNFEFETGKYHTPKIKVDDGFTSDEYLEKLAWEGMTKIIKKKKSKGIKITNEEIESYEKRMEYELSVIKKMEITDYLLIVQDIINWEKRNDFYVGAGRGSCAGSLVCYAIGITSIDSLKYDLLFERFINPARIVMCDIDWDSSLGARDAVLQYLVDTYGRESVCNVATFGLYAPKSALQDMSRGLNKETGMDSILMRKISKIEGIEDAKNLNEFFDGIKKKTTDREIIEWIENNQDTIDFAQRMIGQMRNLGTHAGGILVTPGPVYNYIPVSRGSGNLISAFKEADGSSKDLGALGLMKLDVLGLKTLNLFKECVEQIKKNKGIDLKDEIDDLDLDDKNLIEYFAQGNNFGIFQMDRSKMFTEKMTVDSFDDIVAINAMNRPGPLEKFLNKYGYWKKIDTGEIKLSKEELEELDKERYPFDFMKPILEKTYGCLLYQEQIMQLLVAAGDYNLGEADNFRRVLGWDVDHPKYYTVKKYFDTLEEKLKEKGYTKEDSDKFIQYCKDFAGYSFNKSHSFSYSYITYQTLYFKYYYPAYFYAAMLNLENDTAEYQAIIADARRNKIQILPHSITKSRYNTIAEDDKSVRLGLRMIKGMGGAVEHELEELKLWECKTIDEILIKKFKKINSTSLQNLIDIGCFDEFTEVKRNTIEILKELYQDETILKWFTRQRQPLRKETMPKSLSNNFNEEIVLINALKIRNKNSISLFEDEEDDIEKSSLPLNIQLINLLIPQLKTRNENEDRLKKKTIKKQNELIGFSLEQDSVVQKYEDSLRVMGYNPLRDYEGDEKKDYYFCLLKKEIKLTKTGKEYLQLLINDGIADYKVKCWSVLDIEEGGIYLGNFKKDTYGWTLNRNNVKKLF